jgi:hypothetical protein
MTTRPKRPPNKRQFTELFVRKLKPKATAFVVWDLHQRGLAIRVQPTGRKTWKCIYARHGRTRWLHLGGADAIGLADARTLAAEAMLAVARGKTRLPRRRPSAAPARSPSLLSATSSSTPRSTTRAGSRARPWSAAMPHHVGVNCRRRPSPAVT